MNIISSRKSLAVNWPPQKKLVPEDEMRPLLSEFKAWYEVDDKVYRTRDQAVSAIKNSGSFQSKTLEYTKFRAISPSQRVRNRRKSKLPGLFTFGLLAAGSAFVSVKTAMEGMPGVSIVAGLFSLALGASTLTSASDLVRNNKSDRERNTHGVALCKTKSEFLTVPGKPQEIMVDKRTYEETYYIVKRHPNRKDVYTHRIMGDNNRSHDYAYGFSRLF